MPGEPANTDRGRDPRKRNATSWKPGQSGNPAGAPKRGESVTEMVRAFLDEPAKAGEKRTRRRRLYTALFDLAIGKSSGAVPAARYLLDADRDDEVEECLQQLERRLAALWGEDR